MQFEYITKTILGTYCTNYILHIEKDLKTKLYIIFNVYHFIFNSIKQARHAALKSNSQDWLA